MTPVFLCLAVASAVTASAPDLQRVADWKGAYVAGETAEGRCFYDVGEPMTFRLKLGGIAAVPPGDWTFRWRRTGKERGRYVANAFAGTACQAWSLDYPPSDRWKWNYDLDFIKSLREVEWDMGLEDVADTGTYGE